MPEPRETHAAIDARRNAERGGASERDALIEYLAVGIASALDRYPLINLERGEYDAIAGTAARACLDAGFVPTDSAAHAAEIKAERDALAATVARVRALHHKGSMDFVAGECANEECDHEDVCPEEPRDVCTDCWEQAEEISPYFAEQRCPQWVMWPCDTILALAPSDPATDTGGEGHG